MSVYGCKREPRQAPLRVGAVSIIAQVARSGKRCQKCRSRMHLMDITWWICLRCWCK